ncbi:unnamed protein product [Protopolystoma xenopodis]|uniref:G-patch domain-containing protein n=1 Tax=Protopolystoma xenopodis TaxID=117903 RepID=A0A448XIM5_9PLAT|nr:unnamed protein product [Protopolystoma xenopodis]
MGSNLLTNSANPVLSSSLVASYGDGDESDEGNVSPVAASGLTAPRSAAESKVADEEARLFDWTKLACLLCSRGFKDVATLQKHKAFSALHFTNLNKLRAKYDLPPVQPPSGSAASNPTISSNELTTLPESLSIDALLQLGAVTASNHAKNAAARHRIASEQANALAQAVYRDRAKERRDRYGTSSPPRRRKRADSPPPSPIPTPPPPSHSSAVNTSPQPATTSAEPAGANVGSRLMEKMGWQAGQGLGRANQGRTQIIEAEFREHGVGLGIKNSKRGPPSDNYKDNVKRAMFARFHELE